MNNTYDHDTNDHNANRWFKHEHSHRRAGPTKPAPRSLLPRECPQCGTLVRLYLPIDHDLRNRWTVECERPARCGVTRSDESADDAIEQWLERWTR